MSFPLRAPTRLPAHVAGELLAMADNRCPRCRGLGRTFARHARHASIPCRCACERIFAVCCRYYLAGAGDEAWRDKFLECVERRTEWAAGRAMIAAGLFAAVVYGVDNENNG